MNKILPVTSALLAWASMGLTLAQDVPAKPEPPFLVTPTDTTWTMTVVSANASPTSPPSGTKTGPLQLKQRDVSKKGTLEKMTDTWSDGSKTETWIIDGKRLIGLPNNRGIHLLDPAREHLADIDSIRLDFLNITWLSPDTFLAKESYQGHVCYHFQKHVPDSPLPPATDSDAYTLAVLARQKGETWIDATTKQMVAYNDGTNIYTFAFGPPPADLTPPPEYAQVVKKYQEDMNPYHVPIAPH